MNTIPHGRPTALAGLIVAAALLAACGGSDGAGGNTCQVGSSTTSLAGTWIGTRTEGAQSIPLGAERMLHASSGNLTLTFTESAPDTFTGNIAIDTDICWTEFDGDADPADRAQNASLTITVGVVADCVDFEYDSPIGGATPAEPVRFRAPYPPTATWTGSYNGTMCDTLEPTLPTWKGNFTVTKQ